MDLMGKFEGYNVYRVSNLASAAHEDDCIYVTPAGNMYLWRTCVGVIDMKSGRVMDFEVPEHIQTNVYNLRYARKKRAEEKAKKETEVKVEVKEAAPVAIATDFFERIDAEINALLESVKLEEEKKPIEVYSYEFN